jgi:hypothetical protein
VQGADLAERPLGGRKTADPRQQQPPLGHHGLWNGIPPVDVLQALETYVSEQVEIATSSETSSA